MGFDKTERNSFMVEIARWERGLIRPRVRLPTNHKAVYGK